MKTKLSFLLLAIASLIFLVLQFNCSQPEKAMSKQELIARGKYLVNIGGCNDCHTPKVMTQMGPVPDTTKLLSGHPAEQPVMPIDAGSIAPGKWILTDGGSTMWVGPWGISFTANLTPDSLTGLGSWTLQNFMDALRTGKHIGAGREILPPMPWPSIGKLTDEDLNAVFSYLRSIPPIHNQVPNPIPPNMIEKYIVKN